jgi:hypothetical protein
MDYEGKVNISLAGDQKYYTLLAYGQRSVLSKYDLSPDLNVTQDFICLRQGMIPPKQKQKTIAVCLTYVHYLLFCSLFRIHHSCFSGIIS